MNYEFLYEFLRFFLISENSLKFANFFAEVTNSRSMFLFINSVKYILYTDIKYMNISGQVSDLHQTYGWYTLPMFIFGTRVYMLCWRVPVHTNREHGRTSVNTAVVCIDLIGTTFRAYV